MRRRVVASVAVLGLATAALGTGSAAAFTEVGNNCTAEGFPASDITILQVEKAPESPLPIIVQEPGIATKWRVNIPDVAVETGISLRMIVFRAGGNPGEYRAVARSTSEQLGSGQNVFETRLPVEIGDRFGLHVSGAPGGLICETESSADIIGGAEGDVPIGTTSEFMSVPNRQVPLSAIIEPDEDGDGYGDETQDFCPDDSSEHGPCPQPDPAPVVISPVISPPPLVPNPQLDAFVIRGKRALTILATTNAAAQVRARGLVALPGTGKRRTRRVVRLALDPHVVLPGQLARIRLPFNRLLLKILRSRRAGQKLTARIPITATNTVGAVTRTLTVKLPGQKKRQKRRRR